MKPSQLTTFLASAIAAKAPILITGAPGIGKSALVEQAAREAGADMILSHPAVADPTDAKGLPWANPGSESATFLPFGELAQALKAERPTVWFLDDLGQAPPAVQASFMQLLLARRVNGHRLPDCVTFIAATNRRTDRAGVSGILEPVKSRFVAIVGLEADLDEWCSWALGPGEVPPEVVAFLRFRPDLLSAFQPAADLTNSPVPRTWEHAGKILSMKLPASIQTEALKGAVGEGAATEFLAFLSLWRQLPNIDAILMGADESPLPTQMAALYAVTTGLASRTTEDNFPRVAAYAERLVSESRAEFAVLLIRDILRKVPAVGSTPEFVRLMVGELGQLVSGGGE